MFMLSRAPGHPTIRLTTAGHRTGNGRPTALPPGTGAGRG